MRIHHLHIEAIGPFPDSHDIDFDQLSAGGLFLLEGPTGAGKSTLIDAITYGLYGTLGKAEDTRLPSNHAPLTEPVIEVVFSTNAGIHRTRRTPPWERPKKRGGGFTSQNATAKLWRLSSVDDGIGEPVASTAQEVGTEMQRILGLTRDQFMQTVVLPQGRFSTFLRAKPDERAAVLRDVFGTAIYQQVQDQLAEMARSLRREVTAIQGEVSSAVRAFTRLLPVGDPAAAALSEAGSALDANRMTRIADEVWTVLMGQCAAAGAALDQARTGEVSARNLLDHQRNLERNLARRTALLCERDTLKEQKDVIKADRERLSGAQRAATVAGTMRSHDSATSSMDTAQQAVDAACAELQDTPESDLADLVELSALRNVIDEASGERGGLIELAALETGLLERARRMAEADARLKEALAVLEVEHEEHDARPRHREQLAAALDQLRRSATPVAVAQQVAHQRRAIRDAARRCETQAAGLAEAQRCLERAGAGASAATEKEHAIRLRWINSTAGTLAATLAHGAPCPVCGGTEHPHPAPELPDHASLDDVEAATTTCRLAVAALQEAKAVHIRVAERLEAQREAAAHTTVPDAEKALAAAETEVAATLEVVRLVDVGEQGLIDFDTQTSDTRARIEGAATTTAITAERLRGDRTQWGADQQRCTVAAGDCVSVAERVMHLDARLGRARKLVASRQHHHDAGHRLTDATTALREALLEADFPDVAAARAAQLGTADSIRLQHILQQHDAGVARVSSGLAEEAVALLTGDERVDVAAACRAHELQHGALTAASSARGVAADILERCERDRRELVKILDDYRALTHGAAPVLRMADLANAGEGNAKSTTLSTFVLLRRFEDVVAAANERLAVMSQGRFSLLRIDEREGRARRAGLGLTVRDHHTETNRDPHTLSGGETFYVSLCLALGLADVVTSEAGGISLDTLFIDEGFGSLDPETLDGVLGELTHLQAGGRAVGIVSHVAELKARVPERVEITRRAGGGSTLVVRA